VNVSVRSELLKHMNKTGFLVGGMDPNFHVVITTSQFYLAPRGITPWTGHLYQAILAGCIPVIISDHFEVPFPFLDWGKFSIRWREADASEYLYYHLLEFPLWQRGEMAKRVDEVACWFDYSNTHGPCSPYHGVLAELKRGRPIIPRWINESPVAFQTEGDDRRSVNTLEGVHKRLIHGREVVVRHEKRRLVEMYLENVGATDEMMARLKTVA